MFTIQLGHPKINRIPKQEFGSVKDVFLSLFKSPEEAIYLYWNQIPIRFRYKEDLHWSFNDMLALAWMLQKEKKGETKASFQNQLMRMELVCNWNDDDLTIKGSFKPFEFLYQPYGSALNQSEILKLSKKAFLSEWKTLLHQVLVSLEASNCSIKDGLEHRRLELLRQTENSIQDYGRLYTA